MSFRRAEVNPTNGFRKCQPICSSGGTFRGRADSRREKLALGMDKWVYPLFDGRLPAGINNRVMNELVETVAPKLSAASIRDYMNIVKGVVASTINENGEEILPRKWNDDYIDAPMIDAQRQPSTTADSPATILNSA